MFYCTEDKIGFEKFFLKIKKIILKFYILFNDTQNVINNFIKKLIFLLPFEFLRKIVLFSFWYEKNYIYYICDYSYKKWKYDYEIHYYLLN